MRSFCPVTTNWIKSTAADLYNTREMYKAGRYVVALTFTNNGAAQIIFKDKFTLNPGEIKSIPIPDGTANADVYQWSFTDPSDTNILEIEETIAL